MTDADDVPVEPMLNKVRGEVQVMRSQIRELQERVENLEYMVRGTEEDIVKKLLANEKRLHRVMKKAFEKFEVDKSEKTQHYSFDEIDKMDYSW